VLQFVETSCVTNVAAGCAKDAALNVVKLFSNELRVSIGSVRGILVRPRPRRRNRGRAGPTQLIEGADEGRGSVFEPNGDFRP
jgi:hypothetical protein